ncbi:MAG TPA: hypothetical protein VLJ76_02460 [Gaiellaceae bacterium]|nr:hypothetical protein [Gaiellaceae bacterium]
MIVAMHVASGAAAGALLRRNDAAALAGLALHAAGDAIPHEDFDSLRFETATGLGLLALLALRRGLFDPAVVGAVFSAAPDLDHVLPHRDHDNRKLFPSHRLDGWHREGGISAPVQLAAALVIVGALVLRRKER